MVFTSLRVESDDVDSVIPVVCEFTDVFMRIISTCHLSEKMISH